MMSIKKLSLLFVITLLLAMHSNAQDLIFLQDGSKIESKIEEITPQKIKYKKHINLDGPVYIIDKAEVVMISYENGKNEVFSAKPTTSDTRMKEDKPIEYGQNLVTYHLFDIVFNDFTLSYERVKKDGTMIFQIPIGIGFNNNEYYAYGDYSNLFYSGLGINFYPLGQGEWKYFVGPSLRVGMGRTSFWHSGAAPNWISWEEEVDFMYGKLFINNGIMFNPVSNLSIQAIGSLGIKYFDKDVDDYTPQGVYSSAHFAINMSYRF